MAVVGARPVTVTRAPGLPQLTLPQMLREQARRSPDRVALRQKELGIWKPITWATYYARCCHVGLGLRALGVPEGGHVAVLSENRVEWVLAQLGAGSVGATAVGVKECIVIGEGRKYVSALIQIDYETVGKWAEENRVAHTNFKSLAENPIVRELIDTEVSRANAELAPVSQVRRFHLLSKELDHDDDEVTATMKVRRANIQEKYATEIERLYAKA